MKFKNSHIFKLVAELNPHEIGTGTHYLCDCPSCGKKQHLYLQKETKRIHYRSKKNMSFYWHCKKCDERGSIFTLAKLLGKLNTLLAGRSVDIFAKIQSVSYNIELNNEEEESCSLPLFFTPCLNHKYLQSRNFEDWQYSLYNVGTCSTLNKFKNRVIFPIYNNGSLKAYLSRSTLSKEEHKSLEALGQTVLRYDNSKSNFAAIVGGLDEIESTTRTVICVEGLLDKASVDRAIKSNKQSHTKCICIFGKSITFQQIQLLLLKDIHNLILFLDPDAVKEAKSYSLQLQQFFNVKVAFSPNENDPGSLTKKQILETLLNSKNPFEFYLSKLKSL